MGNATAARLPVRQLRLRLLPLGSLSLAHRNAEREMRREETIMVQGEVQYWGIGRAGR